MIPTLVIAGLIVGAVAGLVSLMLILRFFWLVYDRGGSNDLASAADAVHQVYDPIWADKLTCFLPSGGNN